MFLWKTISPFFFCFKEYFIANFSYLFTFNIYNLILKIETKLYLNLIIILNSGCNEKCINFKIIFFAFLSYIFLLGVLLSIYIKKKSNWHKKGFFCYLVLIILKAMIKKCKQHDINNAPNNLNFLHVIRTGLANKQMKLEPILQLLFRKIIRFEVRVLKR